MGGYLRTREAVRVGIPWINPRAMARVKVEMEGEPKERWRKETKRAKGRLERVKRAKWGAKRTEGVRGEEGTVKVHKSEDGDLEPERKSTSEEGESKIWTEVGVKAATLRPEERRDADERVRQVGVRKKITWDRWGFVGKGELAGEMVRAAHKEGWAIGESEKDNRKWLWSEERRQRRKIREL
jgi:hypothetical protein